MILQGFQPLFAQFQYHENYTTGNGLIQNTVRAIIQDQRDRLWIGTAEGLSIYDGTGFTNYPPTDKLVNPVINCFYKVGKDTVLAGTNGAGILIFKYRKYSTDRVAGIKKDKKYLSNNAVNVMFKDSKDRFWICTDSGVTRWNSMKVLTRKIPFKQEVKFYGENEGLLGTSVYCVVEDNDGSIWFGTNRGLTIYKNDKFSHHIINTRFPDLSINDLCIDKNNGIWIGTVKGLYYYHDGEYINMSKTSNNLVNNVRTIMQDSQGKIWIGTSNGLFQYDNKEFHKFNFGSQYGSKVIISIYEDNEGNIWAGTIHGVYKILNTNFKWIRDNNSLRYIYTIKQDRNSNIWIASSTGLFHVVNGNLILPDFIKKIDTRKIMSLYFDKYNRIWLGTDKGLYSIKNNFIRHYTVNNGLKDNSVIALTGDKNGVLWIGTNKGISYIKLNLGISSKAFSVYKLIQKQLPKKQARSILVDKNNNIWVGYLYDGLYEVKGNKVINFNRKDKLPESNIRYLFQDNSGRIWIATRYRGVYIYSNNRFNNLRSQDGLGSDWTSVIAEDNDNNFWFGTARGITRFDGKHWRTFNQNDGAVSGEVTAATISPNNEVWFGSFNGVLSYTNTHRRSIITEPAVYIKRVEVNGDYNKILQSTTFPHFMNNISITYSGIWFKNESEISYVYKLTHIDDTWSNPVKNNEIHYQNLSPGKYTFEVAAKNSEGTWSNVPAHISFIIESPFWMEWWFQIIALLSLSAVIYIIYNYKIRQVLKVERLRTKIASDLHDDVGTTLSRISLISQLIKENIEPEKVKENLNEIGKLCREALNTMSDIVWSMDSRNDSMESMINRIKDSASAILLPLDINYSFNHSGLEVKKNLNADLRKNIYLIAKEALNNVIKHSDASEVKIDIKNNDGIFEMIIWDNGAWENKNYRLTGHGIRNMKMRAEEIDGDIEINNISGTQIIFIRKNI